MQQFVDTKEYIDREEVLKRAISTGLCDADGNMYGAGDVVLVDDIRGIQAYDVAPVLHGQWLPVDEEEDAFDCSECDAMVKRRHNFCPKCGARMDAENKSLNTDFYSVRDKVETQKRLLLDA